MKDKIEEGCLAIIVDGKVSENIGKLITVGRCLGLVIGYQKEIRWEVDIKILDTLGRYCNHHPEKFLQRLDDSVNTEDIKEEEALEV